MVNKLFFSNKFLISPAVQVLQLKNNITQSNHQKSWHPHIWGVLCQKLVSRAGTSNYIPHFLWDVITCPCPWYLLLAQHPWFIVAIMQQMPCDNCGDCFIDGCWPSDTIQQELAGPQLRVIANQGMSAGEEELRLFRSLFAQPWCQEIYLLLELCKGVS